MSSASEPEAVPGWSHEGAAHSDVGRVRSENEDSFGLFPELGLYVVADGVGGHSGGRHASSLAVETVREILAAPRLDEDLTPVTDAAGNSSVSGRLLTIALEQANERVREASREVSPGGSSRAGMGSTVAALLYDAPSGVLAIAHVGDSRVFRVRGGAVEQLTEDHTLVQQWVREGRMAPEEAATSPHRHVITQAIGTQEIVRPSLRLERPGAGDVFLLSSDGVHDAVHPAEIGSVVQQCGRDLAGACLRLIELANERGGRDNSTAVLVRFLPEPAPGPARSGDGDATVPR